MRFVAHAASLAVISSLCAEPRVGPPITAPPPPTGAAIEILDATVDGNRQVVVKFRLTRDDVPLGAQDLEYLQPAWTLAAVEREPVSQALAWRSLVPNPAGELLKALPIAGPGTPSANVLSNVTQPGAETTGRVVELGAGKFTYTFATVDATGLEDVVVRNKETVRVGVFLLGGAPSPRTTSTFDFVAGVAATDAGGTPVPRDTVNPARCDVCHGTVRAHGGTRTGPRICVTCHTYQHADADTVDPAAPMAATPATNPNPLELGRLVHRIHRGQGLPTLYLANTSAITGAVFPPTGAPIAMPFSMAGTTSKPVRNSPLLNQVFRVVGENGRDRVFGAVVSRTDNGRPATTVVQGISFPQDLRRCDACHDRDGAGAIVDTEISRRACQGCHPDVWFDATPVPDSVHVAHPGGPQADDARCAGCHVAAQNGSTLWAPIASAHVAPAMDAPQVDHPKVSIIEVRDLQPGKYPTIVFEVSDRRGKLDRLDAPDPASDTASPVPRAVTSGTLILNGPTAASRDYSVAARTLPVQETFLSTNPNSPVPYTQLPDGNRRFSYTLTGRKIPDDAKGTWTVEIGVRRSYAPSLWDPAANGGAGKFNWPYTGETLNETATNDLVDVDLATGTYVRGTTPPPATARRKPVDTANCERCHRRLSGHGGSRNRVETCILCHAADRSDWPSRTKGPDGNVLLSATFDGLEERSTQFKVMIHRIHAGEREGAAEPGARPYVIGNRFYDKGEFPNDLSNCPLCHAGDSYRVEAVPPDAEPTRVNETPTIRHAKTAAHADGEAIPPIQAACGGCHRAGPAWQHMQDYTVDGAEKCVGCHGDGRTRPVSKVHKIAAPG